MRIGNNPAKLGLAAHNLQPLAVVMPVYIPQLDGYFLHALEVLRCQLASIRQYTPVGQDIIVFDNGSCPEAQAELARLQAEGWIDVLTLSAYNLGKTGAINWMVSALPHEWVCYTDSDVLFRPGWYEASLQLHETFPKVGFVAAQPSFYDVLDGSGVAHQALLQTPGFEAAARLAESAEAEEYAYSLGNHPEILNKVLQREWTVVSHSASGVQAILGASHMQFLARREVLRQVLPLPATQGLSSREDRQLDQRIDQLGYLHLSTLQSYVYHLGNALDDRIRPELEKLEMEAVSPLPAPAPAPRSAAYRLLARLVRQPALLPRFKRLYSILFEILSES